MKIVRDRPRHEDIISTALHGTGVGCAIAALSVLTVLASGYPGAGPVLLMILYGVTAMASYAASTLYHLFRDKPVGRHFQTLDHCLIYTHIAGTTTAPAILALYDHFGLLLAILSWSFALVGIVIRVFFFRKLHAISPLFYLAVGFIVFAWSGPIVDVLGVGALLLIAGGGLSYAVGVVIFSLDRLPYNNVIWHLFVLGGSVCHFLAIVLFVLPVAEAG